MFTLRWDPPLDGIKGMRYRRRGHTNTPSNLDFLGVSNDRVWFRRSKDTAMTVSSGILEERRCSKNAVLALSHSQVDIQIINRVDG